MMIHVLPKIIMWLLLLGAVYLVFGPQSFDSSRGGDPLQNASSQLFLPPAKSGRLLTYERRLHAGQLEPAEFSDYRTLAKTYQQSFWEGDDMSVEEALSGVRSHRGDHLAAMLAERGLTKEEQSVFFTVLKRDHPALLEDRE